MPLTCFYLLYGTWFWIFSFYFQFVFFLFFCVFKYIHARESSNWTFNEPSHLCFVKSLPCREFILPLSQIHTHTHTASQSFLFIIKKSHFILQLILLLLNSSFVLLTNRRTTKRFQLIILSFSVFKILKHKIKAEENYYSYLYKRRERGFNIELGKL